MTALEVVWHCPAPSSAEHCRLAETDDGWELHGLTVLPINDKPGHIDDVVHIDHYGRTCSPDR